MPSRAGALPRWRWALFRAVLAVALLTGGPWAPPADAVSFQGAGRIGGNVTDTVAAIARDPSGAVYLTGRFGGASADFDPGPGVVNLPLAGNFDAYVVKLDSAGAFVWAKGLGGPLADGGTAVVADASGVYVAGTFEDTIDLDPGPGTAIAVGQGASDVFLVKLDTSGNFVWGISFGYRVEDIGAALALSGNDLYMVGSFRGTVDLDPGPGVVSATSQNGTTDAFVSKFDAGTGSLVWAKALNGTQEDQSRGVAADGTGVYITGTFNGTTDFDPGLGVQPLTAVQNSFDVFVLKLDASGTFDWVDAVGGPGLEIASGIALGGSSLYLAGYFAGTTDFDPGAGTATLSSVSGSFDAYLLKLDAASGSFGWVKRFGDAAIDFGLGVAATASDVYLTGFFGGTVDFDPGGGTFALTATGPNDAFVARLSAAGELQTAYRLGGNGSTAGVSLVLDGSKVYLTGTFIGTGDFDPGPGTASLTSQGASDVFLSIVDAVPDPPTAVPDAFTVSAGSTLNVPAPGVLANDVNPGGSGAGLQAVLVTPPTRGSLTLRPDGSFTYVPSAGAAGTEQFTYRAVAGAVSSAPATVTLTITPTTCAPRPAVQLTTTPTGGRLRVTVAASPLGSGGANQIQELRFLANRSNAVVTVNGTTIAPSGVVSVPVNAGSVTFEVSRATAGVATTVPFVVVDACGEWPSFVGGGPSAF